MMLHGCVTRRNMTERSWFNNENCGRDARPRTTATMEETRRRTLNALKGSERDLAVASDTNSATGDCAGGDPNSSPLGDCGWIMAWKVGDASGDGLTLRMEKNNALKETL